jgi:hypothetical protein
VRCAQRSPYPAKEIEEYQHQVKNGEQYVEEVQHRNKVNGSTMFFLEGIIEINNSSANPFQFPVVFKGKHQNFYYETLFTFCIACGEFFHQ